MPNIARLRAVYPRARGGTSSPPDMSPPIRGLSPRTRGNPGLGGRQSFGSRSIPAHAGEPGRTSSGRLGRWVYPRARGGTPYTRASPYTRAGLSPRTRGNQAGREGLGRRRGSIPAHAGEPLADIGIDKKTRVYPRARGGTVSAKEDGAIGKGLSPRTRGNRIGGVPAAGLLGSIPAHAGEPHGCGARRTRTGVYPRARGGTSAGYDIVNPIEGLSPRTRGNRPVVSGRVLDQGSIPAHAGEPEITARRLA